jgi:FxsC-like protein
VTGSSTPSRVFTFYSFKGGVGRSMALANTAVLLARKGARVLIVDWDLEAPGLDQFFRRNTAVSVSVQPEDCGGIVDLMLDHLERVENSWREHVVSVRSSDGAWSLDLLPSGRRGEDYVPRLQQLDWDRLFQEYDLAVLLESMREEWLGVYDHILVDSRTGISDSGGICTIYLPDVIFAFFTTNHQSMLGVADVLRRVRSARSTLPTDRQALIAVPVSSRDESRTEYVKGGEWRQRFAETFSEEYRDFLPRGVSPEKALELLRVPNVPFWSFGESLPVLTESGDGPDTISYAFGILARLIASDLDWNASVRSGSGGADTDDNGQVNIGSSEEGHGPTGEGKSEGFHDRVRGIGSRRVGSQPISEELKPASNLLFFFSYAHTPERPWVEKLFNDIRLEVLERTTLPLNSPVGFMDTNTVPPGHLWREDVARALATCSVFVPLFSPRYFTSEECGVEWHAFAQRFLHHQALHPGKANAIVPALWTPVEPRDVPAAARDVHVCHTNRGYEYATEGFYALIKNSLYRQEYVTAVQRLSVEIIKAAETVQLRPCQVRDLEPLRNAFAIPGRQSPGDRRLSIVVVAPSVDRLPPGRNSTTYGPTARDWNPFHPETRQGIADFAASVARLSAFEPTILGRDEGRDFLARGDPAAGLGLLLVDPWSTADPDLAQQLRELDSLGGGWVRTMVLWNIEDPQTQEHAVELREKLSGLLPHSLGRARPFGAPSYGGVTSLKEFRTTLPDSLDSAFYSYLSAAEAYPPPGDIPRRPRLSRSTEWQP